VTVPVKRDLTEQNKKNNKKNKQKNSDVYQRLG